MCKTSRFRGPFNKENGKWDEILFKAERLQLYQIYWSLRRQISLKKSLSMISEIFGLFVNPLTADGKYCLLKRGNLLQHFQMQLPQKRKKFYQFFFFFDVPNLDSIFNSFKKKINHITQGFSNWRTGKNVVS